MRVHLLDSMPLKVKIEGWLYITYARIARQLPDALVRGVLDYECRRGSVKPKKILHLCANAFCESGCEAALILSRAWQDSWKRL